VMMMVMMMVMVMMMMMAVMVMIMVKVHACTCIIHTHIMHAHTHSHMMHTYPIPTHTQLCMHRMSCMHYIHSLCESAGATCNASCMHACMHPSIPYIVVNLWGTYKCMHASRGATCTHAYIHYNDSKHSRDRQVAKMYVFQRRWEW
jgi:hypothetical protein